MFGGSGTWVALWPPPCSGPHLGPCMRWEAQAPCPGGTEGLPPPRPRSVPCTGGTWAWRASWPEQLLKAPGTAPQEAVCVLGGAAGDHSKGRGRSRPGRARQVLTRPPFPRGPGPNVGPVLGNRAGSCPVPHAHPWPSWLDSWPFEVCPMPRKTSVPPQCDLTSSCAVRVRLCSRLPGPGGKAGCCVGHGGRSPASLPRHHPRRQPPAAVPSALGRSGPGFLAGHRQPGSSATASSPRGRRGARQAHRDRPGRAAGRRRPGSRTEPCLSPKSGPASPRGETTAWPGPGAAQRAGRRPGPPRAGAGLTAGVRAAETEGENAGAPGSVPREGRAPGKHPTRRAAGGQATRSGREKLEARWLTCPAGLNQR